MTDKLISIHQIPEEEENNVKRGPSDNIDSYLRSLEKLRKCVEFFMKSKPGSHDLEKCKSLFIEGADYLNREFRVILMHNCKPVAPAKLQEIINSHYDLDAISLSSHGSLNSLTSTNSIDAVPELAIEHICESALDKLRLIANWLSEVASNEGRTKQET
ncbi:uncharacterized protein TRIADDRAFT_53056 [Trichoplax adhaerens]|uniref:Uncharacterized protein n=1 Tax=Trichoplax adhaerens TaxID=10228 RepID=B3RN66_TRIAD|nr:hypothetical protein TRIADDRAFT_53056 [Trichoplax adhaerens]EDV27967.1 hypothetical protein TRIADDRAFT_53056 [Trichoplax adhaerens]|eukprot:XP_002109801.1 hypothetical protein TRIADDRAFT_53056 [Trichoplax adhaerens]